MEMTKDTTIGGQRFQLGRLRASTGSWLLNRLLQVASAEPVQDTVEVPAAKRPHSFAGNEDGPCQVCGAAKDTDIHKPVDPEVLTMVYVQRLLASLDEAQLDTIQGKCLMCCSRYDVLGQAAQAHPIPLMNLDGRVSDPELAYDFMTVSAITTQCMIFNLLPFFAARLAETT